ncbi:hypothetical protein C9374_013895 [Naegleria lovaniensis]|uniref:Uncharacterized protein n=1 Tax=Naegleria lovaniensis TaxID=51637 RepID=A0AA88KMU8_NAELO|nr:uncharacterized protein C9374_013895 [Naegleria lovaniensis]KAG2389335.1 hypothetical protein C9374_013895 [Naegleria lovaniensis]
MFFLFVTLASLSMVAIVLLALASPKVIHRILNEIFGRTIWASAVFRPEAPSLEKYDLEFFPKLESDSSSQSHNDDDGRECNSKIYNTRIVKVTPCKKNSTESVTLLTCPDLYSRLRTNAVCYTLLYPVHIEEQVLLKSLSQVLSEIPLVGAKYLELDSQNKNHLKLLSETEQELVKGRKKKILVLDHSNAFVNVLIRGQTDEISKRVDDKLMMKQVENLDDFTDHEREELFGALVFETETCSPYSKKEISRIQVTYLKSGKMVLSLTLNHSVGGADTGYYFLRSWCEMAKFGKLSEIPILDRTDMIYPRHLLRPSENETKVNMEEEYLFYKYLLSTIHCLFLYKSKERTLNFSVSKLDRMKEQVRNSLCEKQQDTSNLVISTNDIICGILFKLMALSDPSLSNETILSFRFVANFAPKYPPYNKKGFHFVGNSLMAIWIHKTKQELLDMTLNECICMIRQHVLVQYTEENARQFIKESSRAYFDEGKSDFYKPIIQNVRTTFSLTNWCKYSFVRDCDFGKGAPQRFLQLEKMDALHHGFLVESTPETLQLKCGLTDREYENLREMCKDLIVV